MAHRSERFDAGQLAGLGQVFEAVDGLETLGLPIQDEVMAGKSHRRQLDPSTVQAGMDVNYLLQVTFAPPQVEEGLRMTAKYYLNEANTLLSGLVLPGEVSLDRGGLKGYDETRGGHAFGSTGRTEDDVTRLYPPWLRASWSEEGRSLLFFCGIHPPKEKRLLEDRMHDWDVRSMRRGRVVFTKTPTGLSCH